VWNDLFHDRIQPNEIMDALGVMARCEQHLFMVLTKRADRMRELAYRYALNSGWMPRNVCLGVSVWDQGSAEANIPPLLEAKRMTGCRTFVSYEPALGPVQFDDLVTRRGDCEDHRDCLHCDVGAGDDQEWGGCSLDLVIMGGESGPGARPMHPDWARSVRDQCQAAGVPFLMKQMSGRTAAERKAIPDDLNIREWFKE
jgi:protein gp37